MAEMDYRFNDMDATNQAVGVQLQAFQLTLDQFKSSYTKLAGLWGGSASESAAGVAKRLEGFGAETARIVKAFLDAMVEHREDSMLTEATNTRRFDVG